MMFRFDRAYVTRNKRRVAMFVANGVVNDSRVLKTAQTVKKLGYDLTLFGVCAATDARELDGYNFRVILLPRPSSKAVKRRSATDGARIDFNLYSDLLAGELAKALKDLKPTVLHTHDMLGLAVGGALPRHAPGLRCRWIHDVHEYVAGLTELPESTRLFFYDVEKECIHDPDYLTCVSPALIDILVKDHGLRRAPAVVLNAPRRSDFDRFHPNDVRSAVRLDTDEPLLVYSGNVKPVRGIDTIILALSQLPRVHLAVITNSKGTYRDELVATAERLGVRDRLHFLPYVHFANVTSFLRTATAGVHPIKRYPNAEIALPNKLFEYIHAAIPSIVSDSKAMMEFVAQHGCGKAFRTEDPSHLAATVQNSLAMLNDDACLRSKLEALADEYSWEAQESKLAAIYSDLDEIDANASQALRKSSGLRILHLPAASAGQPATLAETLKKRGCQAGCLRIGAHRFKYNADLELASFKQTKNDHEVFQDILDRFDVLHYHARPLYLSRKKYPAGLDLLIARAAGKRVFFHFRGSEMRMSSLFKKASCYNYVDENPKGVFTTYNESQQRQFLHYVRAVCNGMFVVDPELQSYAPEAMIVPRVIDLKEWGYVGANPKGVLKVVHAPSRREFKGTDAIIAAVHNLLAEGVPIALTLVENLPNEEAAQVYRRADVIVDQLRIGWYGVLAVEGMALGKAVVSFVRDDLKHHLPYPFPLAVANPDNLHQVLRNLAQNHDLVRDLGRRGREYVELIHDARQIADMLLEVYETNDRPISTSAVWAWLDEGSRAKVPKAAQPTQQVWISRKNVLRFLRKGPQRKLARALGKAGKAALQRLGRVNTIPGRRFRVDSSHDEADRRAV